MLAVAVAALALGACGATEDTETVGIPLEAAAVQGCLEAGGATVTSVDDLGQILTVTAEGPKSSARIVIAVLLEMHSINQGEEFAEPAEASAALGTGATAVDKALASECSELI